MKLMIISGSPRMGSQSGKLAHLLTKRLSKRRKEVTCAVLDLAEPILPELTDDVFKSPPTPGSRWYSTLGALSDADGFVVITPEFHGMVPPGLKTLFMLSGEGPFCDKPALPVGVSDGMGGVWPIAELRVSSFRGNRLCWIPDDVVVRRVSEVNAATERAFTEPSQKFPAIWARLDASCDLLIGYTRALSEARKDGAIQRKHKEAA